MASRRNRNRLIMAGAAAAASALAFYFAWKAFTAYESDPDEEDPEFDAQNVDNDEKELQDLENLMKISEEKRRNRAEGIPCIAEEESEFKVEEFEKYIAEEYGALLADGTKKSLDNQDSQQSIAELCARNEKGESEVNLNDPEIPNGGLVMKEDGIEEDVHSTKSSGAELDFCCSNSHSTIEGMSSEGLLSQFSSGRNVGFDELSMQDLSGEDVMFFEIALEASDSQGQISPDFEFDSSISGLKIIDMSVEGVGIESSYLSDGRGLPRQTSEAGHDHDYKAGNLDKPFDLEFTLESKLDSGINNGVEGLGPEEPIATSDSSDDSLEYSSAIENNDPDHDISTDSTKSLEEQISPLPEVSNTECLSLVGCMTETSNPEDMESNEADRHVLEVGISSSNDTTTGQPSCLLEEDAEGQISTEVGFNTFHTENESSSVASCNYHLHQQPLESGKNTNEKVSPKLDVDNSTNDKSIEDLSSRSPKLDDKDPDRLLNHVLEDVKNSDLKVNQQPNGDSMDNNNHALEDSTSESVRIPSSSSVAMDYDTVSNHVFEDARNSSKIATHENCELQRGTDDAGEQFNGQTSLLQTFDYANIQNGDGNLKFKKQWSQLLSLPHMSSGEFSENLLEGVRSTSIIESGLNGDFAKHSDGLDAYDEYLADPSLSPSMKSQVSRAKAIAQKLYASREG